MEPAARNDASAVSATSDICVEAKASVLAKEVREMVNILEAEGNSVDRVLAEKWHLILDPVEETLTENEPRGVLKP